MTQDRTRSADLLGLQLSSVPMINQAVQIERVGEGQLRLRVALAHRGWSRALSRILPLSSERSVELDKVGAEVLLLCDGVRSVEKIIDLHADRWLLSFFESRGMILPFLKRLMRHDFVVLATSPPPNRT